MFENRLFIGGAPYSLVYPLVQKIWLILIIMNHSADSDMGSFLFYFKERSCLHCDPDGGQIDSSGEEESSWDR